MNGPGTWSGTLVAFGGALVHVSVLGAAFIIALLLLGCHDNSVSIYAVWLRYMASCFVSSDQGRGEGAFNVCAPKGVKPVVQTRLLVEL